MSSNLYGIDSLGQSVDDGNIPNDANKCTSIQMKRAGLKLEYPRVSDAKTLLL
jgi:hypothetical protein